MSWSANHSRVLRGTTDPGELFVLGDDARVGLPTHSALSTAADLVEAGARRATELATDAETEAASCIARAQAEADAVRRAAFDEGMAAGQAHAFAEVEGLVSLARAAAEEGKAIRDEIASQAAMVVARAVGLAVRRMVGEYYAGDPGRTVKICAEALRAAAGQEVLALRVNPEVVGAVQAGLVDASEYVRPDEGIEIGGCVIDLRNGTIDASLDARLSLLELTLGDASGAAAA